MPLSEGRIGDERARADVTPLRLFSILIWTNHRSDEEPQLKPVGLMPLTAFAQGVQEYHAR